jgi:hypothetical protein
MLAAAALAVLASATGCGKNDSASPSPEPLADVTCGPVTDAGGSPTVIAIVTPAGRVGCTEAINVAAE